LATMLYLLKSRHNIGGALPLLGLYAYGTIRMLPALQGTFAALNTLRFNSAIVATVGKEFDAASVTDPKNEGPQEPLDFEREIRLDNVSFAYARSPRPVLEGISITLQRGEW